MSTTTVFSVPGLDCPAEEKLIRNKLHNMKNIDKLEFNFINQELRVTHSLVEISSIEKAISEIGMQAIIKTGSWSEIRSNKVKSKVVLHNWILVVVASIAALSSELYAYVAGSEKSVWVLLLALIAIILTGGPTLKKGYLALRSFTLNINFLMLIAITGALMIGEWPEAAMVTVLFALAEIIERYSLDKARLAIEGLMDMAPEEAVVKVGDNWQTKAVTAISVDDIIKVKPGDRIALDGVIINGQSSVNQAPVTGESVPVEKNIGDVVYAGTINQYGTFEFRVTSTISNTLLAKIIHAVEEAQAVKAPTERFVDQFSKYYTPLMVLIALLIAVVPPVFFAAPFYLWLYKALVILVIACPCALVISTPVTIVSGLAAAAKYGLVIKGGTYLENAHKIRAVALDKTGTLTMGKPTVTDIFLVDDAYKDKLLIIAATLDVNSEHPIAHAIVNAYHEKTANSTLLEVSQFIALPGRGVTGVIDGIQYYVGNHQLAEDNGVCNPEIEKILERFESQGKTTVIVSTLEKVLGIVAVADSVRETSAHAITQLHKLGIKTVMITGDNAITAAAIGRAVGVDEIHANMLPEGKLVAIEGLIKTYKFVGMVGDGINDAPALAKANIGFAMGRAGTDVALETADVALMDDNLNKLPIFVRLSKKTVIVLIQNISFSIIVKGIFFVLALMGLASLWMAVFADMGASLIVVLNGLRLLKYKCES